MEKVAIFVVGNRNSGKSTTIRALTGCGDELGRRRRRRSHLWNVRSNSDRILRAFVFHRSPHECGGPGKYPPSDFPDCLERENGIGRNDYDIFIGALELISAWRRYRPEAYIRSMTSKGFDVKVALVVTYWELPDPENEWPTVIQHENNLRLRTFQDFLRNDAIPNIEINTTLDPNETGGGIRQGFYP